MKLNVKRTLLVGLAFMSISAFWQLYDTIIPLILKNDFALEDGFAGFIMALDNILALFLLPLFGLLSDRCGMKIGRRMPFILGGTAVAALVMLRLPGAANDGNATLFYIGLGVLLIAMGTYRSPAVALMPDVTPKPLRSKGNAIINLMGAVGGVFALAAIQLLVKKAAEGSFRVDYGPVFIAVAAFMVVAVVALALTVRERRLVKEMEDIHYGVDPEEEQATQVMEGGTEKLPPALFRSLLLILFSVFLWFMGYNAITTAFSKYAQEMWNMGPGAAAACLMVATGGAIVSYLPIGILSARFGRKRMIQFGIILLSLCFASGMVFTAFTPALYVMFALVGCAAA
jgi:Na+/melibiose symporter-like transporter